MQKKIVNISIPKNVCFSDLQLNRDKNGISFNWEPLEQICENSDYSFERLLNSPEDDVCALIVQWYFVHRQNGGKKDLIAEELISEVIIEDSTGQYDSFPAGTS